MKTLILTEDEMVAVKKLIEKRKTPSPETRRPLWWMDVERVYDRITTELCRQSGSTLADSPQR